MEKFKYEENGLNITLQENRKNEVKIRKVINRS